MRLHSGKTIEAYDILVALLESELGQLLAYCQAVGVASPNLNSRSHPRELDGRKSLLLKSQENRMIAQTAATQFIQTVPVLKQAIKRQQQDRLSRLDIFL